MSLRDELERLGAVADPEEKWQTFAQMDGAKQAELIEYNDEHVRQWRAVCQLCRAHLTGTRAELRAHKCDAN